MKKTNIVKELEKLTGQSIQYELQKDGLHAFYYIKDLIKDKRKIGFAVESLGKMTKKKCAISASDMTKHFIGFYMGIHYKKQLSEAMEEGHKLFNGTIEVEGKYFKILAEQSKAGKYEVISYKETEEVKK